MPEVIKFCHFEHAGRREWGLVTEGEENIRRITGDPFKGYSKTAETVAMSEVRLLPPARPTKIVALGLNYRDHAEEVNLKLPEEPLLFLKPSTAVIGPGDPIEIPPLSQRVDYEGELGVVIGKRTKNVDPDRAGEAIAGYLCFNDVTARDLQYKDKQWTRAKSFDTFAPMGPYLVQGLDPSALALKTELNGRVVQSTSTDQLIFPVPFIVSFISRVMTLLPGDVIATGTTSGIGPMRPGDKVTVTIEGIGALTNPVVKA